MMLLVFCILEPLGVELFPFNLIYSSHFYPKKKLKWMETLDFFFF